MSEQGTLAAAASAHDDEYIPMINGKVEVVH
jgi:hypothetical protein